MQLSRGQSLVTDENLQKMGDELVRLCDNIERHGLVDYQYGVWETQIIDSRLALGLLGFEDQSADACGKNSPRRMQRALQA